MPEIGVSTADDGDASPTRNVVVDSSKGYLRIPTSKNNNDNSNRNLESMRNSLIDVEQRLKGQRIVAGRPYDLDTMTPEQLLQEKVDLQSALLQFEHLFGHPETSEEKDMVKDVYDRYRSVKRHVRRSSSIRSKDPLELETIPEDLEIPLTLASPQVCLVYLQWQKYLYLYMCHQL